MRRSIALISVSVLLFALVGAAGFGQSGSLPVSAIRTVVDGVVHPNEYSFSQGFGPLTLSANRTADTLYLAVSGKTTGQVAVGLGSRKMNGATIFMGFVDGDGKVQFKAQAGAYITSGQSALDLIFALGEDKSFTPLHSCRNVTSLKLN